MSKTHQDGDSGFLEQDREIIRDLQSSDGSIRERGAVRLKARCHRPLAMNLEALARNSASEAYRRIPIRRGQIDEDEYEDMWQEAVKDLLKNVERKDFEIRKSLLAYMTAIAGHNLAEQWAKDRGYRFDPGHNGEDRSCSGFTPLSRDVLPVKERLKQIEEFYDSLNPNDQLAFLIIMRHKVRYCAGRGNAGREVFQYETLCSTEDTNGKAESLDMKSLAEEIRRSGAWTGKTDTILRRYRRLMEKLVAYLKERDEDD